MIRALCAVLGAVMEYRRRGRRLEQMIIRTRIRARFHFYCVRLSYSVLQLRYKLHKGCGKKGKK